MSLESIQRDLEAMKDFKERLLAFYVARQPLLDMRRERDETMTPFTVFDEERFKRRGEEALPALVQARSRVAERLVEATEVANRYGLPTELKILPASLIGGYSHTLNLFKAAIEPELPHDFNLEPRQVFDVVDQTIYACERQIRDWTAAKPVTKAFSTVGWAVASAFRAIFKSETDRAIVKWLVFVLLGGLALRFVFGVKLEAIGKLIVDKVMK